MNTHPHMDEHGKPVVIKKPTESTPLSTWLNNDQVAIVVPQGKMPLVLNDVLFDSFQHSPTRLIEWSDIADSMVFSEPDFTVPFGYKPAAGAVIVEPDGRVWLVSPTNQFAGYINTFPKGTVKNYHIRDVNPEDLESINCDLRITAINEVYEESGLRVRLTGFLGDFKRSLSYTRYYLAERIDGNPADMGWESQAVMLAPIERLRELLTNANDKPIVDLLLTEYTPRKPELTEEINERPTAKKSDFKTVAMPKEHITLPLNICLSASDSAAIRKGYISQSQDQKWSSYYANNTLFIHRSCYGYCNFQVHFVDEGDGLRATHAEVNRNNEQCNYSDNDADIGLIAALIDGLAQVNQQPLTTPSFVSAIQLAAKPQYLGNPVVVTHLINRFFNVTLKKLQFLSSLNDQYHVIYAITRAMTEDDTGYTRMPGWHIEGALGKTLIEAFNLDIEYYQGENLGCLVSEGLMSVSLALNELFNIYKHNLENLSDELTAKLNIYRDFIVTVFLGTNAVAFPNKTLANLLESEHQKTPFERLLDDLERLDEQENEPEEIPSFEIALKELEQVQKKMADAQQKLQPFRFSNLGIPEGTELLFKLNPEKKCIVSEKNKVLLNGENMSLSLATVTILNAMGRNVKSARGPDYWLYQGITLTKYRELLIKSN